MPNEFRRLTFHHDEVKQAIADSSARPVGKVPGGDITLIKPVQDKDDHYYELSFFDYAKNKEESVRVAEGGALSAIIELCISTKIPLPLGSQKTLRLVDQNLCLDIFMGEAAAPAAAE